MRLPTLRSLAAAALLLLATATTTSAKPCPQSSMVDSKKHSFKVEAQANNQPPVPCTQKLVGDRKDRSYIVVINCGTFKIEETNEGLAAWVERAPWTKSPRTPTKKGVRIYPLYRLFDKAGNGFFFPNYQSTTSHVTTCSSDGTRETLVATTVLKSDAARVVITRTKIEEWPAKAQF